jgi:predicted patatin/cPLA2 family phospholipase
MNEELEELLKELRSYRNDMVARNYPYQEISDIITKWEMRDVPGAVAPSRRQDFLEEATKENKKLKDSYQESVRQAKERKTVSEHSQDNLEPIISPMSDE